MLESFSRLQCGLVMVDLQQDSYIYDMHNKKTTSVYEIGKIMDNGITCTWRKFLASDFVMTKC
jgi:hypothetical protein